MIQQDFSRHPHPLPPSNPGCVSLNNFPDIVVSPTGQNGSNIVDVTAIVKAPKNPAAVPTTVTPPFVPGGTSRSFQDVISRGLRFERIPSSEENVSAATAA